MLAVPMEPFTRWNKFHYQVFGARLPAGISYTVRKCDGENKECKLRSKSGLTIIEKTSN